MHRHDLAKGAPRESSPGDVDEIEPTRLWLELGFRSIQRKINSGSVRRANTAEGGAGMYVSRRTIKVSSINLSMVGPTRAACGGDGRVPGRCLVEARLVLSFGRVIKQGGTSRTPPRSHEIYLVHGIDTKGVTSLAGLTYSLIVAAACALAAGDPLGASKRNSL